MVDTTASYLVHYCTACILFLLLPWLQSRWLQLIFGAEMIVHLSVAHIIRRSETSLVHYLNGNFPNMRLLVVWFLGVGNFARWGLSARLLFSWDSPQYFVFSAFSVRFSMCLALCKRIA